MGLTDNSTEFINASMITADKEIFDLGEQKKQKHNGLSLSIYEVREAGREFCKTDGSNHYHQNKVDPVEVMMELGIAEDFFIGNILKYAIRFKHDRKLEDIKKVSDYAHLLTGMLLLKESEQLR